MMTDKTTLKDLEIFESSGISIFEIFNKTKTYEGASKLKDILKNPLSKISDINNRQSEVKWILENVNFDSFSFENDKIFYIEYYLDSNIIGINIKGYFNTLAKGIIYFIQNKKYYEYFFESILIMKTFFQRLKDFYSNFKEIALPEGLEKALINIKYLLENKSIQRLTDTITKENLKLNDVFFYDHLFRIQLVKVIKKAISEIGSLDALIAISKIIKEKNMVFPKIINSQRTVLNIKGLYHLSLDTPIKNNLEIENHLIFLTGANMSGKTTFMRSLGVAVYLAHLGIAVPAEKMELSIFDGIITGIETEDNIKLGYSFFYSEVMRVKEALEFIKEKDNVLLLFDEIFKGTNLKDGFSATEMVVRGLARQEKGLYLISSHLIELEDELKKINGISYKCFKIEYKNNDIEFTYKLEDGISSDRIGMHILSESGICKLLEN